VLFCPVTDAAAETESQRAFAEGYFLEKASLDWFYRRYCGDNADLAEPAISPLRAADLRGLPPAHIHTAGYDPLRGEGQACADALRRAGVAVRYACHEGMVHHFYNMTGTIPAARVALKEATAAIETALAN